MPPGVHIGPVKGSTLVRDAQRKSDAQAADKASAVELQRKYHEFIKAVEDLSKGDYVKLRDDDYKLLQSELEAFSKIEAEECYASPWEDCMGEPMVGKAFRVIHACGHTGQLIISALPESVGSRIIRESTWSERFVNRMPGGDMWLLPATAFQKLKVEVRGHLGQELFYRELDWYQGFINSRTCYLCKEPISRSEHRYRSEEKDCFICPDCYTKRCKETLNGDVLTRSFVYGVASAKVFLQEVATSVEEKYSFSMLPGAITVSFNEKKVEGSLIYKRCAIFNFSNFNWEEGSFHLQVKNFLAEDRVEDWKTEFEAVSEAKQGGVFKIEWSGDLVKEELADLGRMS